MPHPRQAKALQGSLLSILVQVKEDQGRERSKLVPSYTQGPFGALSTCPQQQFQLKLTSHFHLHISSLLSEICHSPCCRQSTQSVPHGRPWEMRLQLPLRNFQVARAEDGDNRQGTMGLQGSCPIPWDCAGPCPADLCSARALRSQGVHAQDTVETGWVTSMAHVSVLPALSSSASGNGKSAE